MSQIITRTSVTGKRIRELSRAHDRAWTRRARVLRESKSIVVPIKELTQRAHAPLLALLAEGVPEGQWVAASYRRCVLIEREADELVLRSARRQAVEFAPREAEAKTIVEQSISRRRRRYRDAMVAVRRISGWTSVLAAALFASGTVVGLLAEGSQEVLRGAVWCLIAAMTALVVHMLARVSVPELLDDVGGDGRGWYGDGYPDGDPGGEAADVVRLYDDRPRVLATSADDESQGAESEASSLAHADPERPPEVTVFPASSEPERGGPNEAPITTVEHYEPSENPSVTGLAARFRRAYESLLFVRREGAGYDRGEPSPAANVRSPSDEPGYGDGFDTESENWREGELELLEKDLQGLPEGDLVEGFAHARALPDNDAQGSDDIRVVEARGELAAILGIGRGEAVLEVVWSTSGGGRSGHSYLPYRELVSGTSLDPVLEPSRRFRPTCRQELHEVLTEEKALGSLEPKITYRIGPDSYQFFNCALWSGGADGNYILEDKIKYLLQRVEELGVNGRYSSGQLRRMEEIAAYGGYAPTHEELLRFALIAGVEPRFLFEDSEEDLRRATKLGSDPGQPVLWRVEAAISEAHGVPVEIFERRLMDWHISAHSWRFR